MQFRSAKADSTDALNRVERDYEAFSEGVARCQGAPSYTPADYQDAYERLYRLKQRFMKEQKAKSLGQSEYKALSKVFEKDRFIDSLLDIRNVSAHVLKGGDLAISTKDNELFNLPIETSAGALFAESRPVMNDISGEPRSVDHQKILEEAKRRVERAICKAKTIS